MVTQIVAHVRSNLYSLICLSHVIRLRAVTSCFFFQKDLFFLMRAQYVLRCHIIQIPLVKVRFLLENIFIQFPNLLPGYLNYMVDQNILRTHERKYDFSEEKNPICNYSLSNQMPSTAK